MHRALANDTAEGKIDVAAKPVIKAAGPVPTTTMNIRSNRRAASAPARTGMTAPVVVPTVVASTGESNVPVISAMGRRMSIKQELPRFNLGTKRQSIISPHFFEQGLNIHDLPRSTKEFQAYARLSKLSDTELQQVLMEAGLVRYQFRSPHEIKMALVSLGNTGRSRTPLSEEWRKKAKAKAESREHFSGAIRFRDDEDDGQDDEYDVENDMRSHSSLSTGRPHTVILSI